MRISKSVLNMSVLAPLVLANLVACGTKHSDHSTIDVASIQANRSLTKEQKAEELSRGAEQLISASGFMYADTVVGVALAVDPHNLRARFWKAALAPTMELRGIVNRIAPLALTSKNADKYKKFMAELQNGQTDKSVAEFLMDGPQDIRTERELQDKVARITLKLDEFRTTLKSMKNADLEIRLNTDLKTAAKSESCVSRQIGEGMYVTDYCEAVLPNTVKLNHADFLALQQSVAGVQVYLSALNSYDLTGSFKIADASENQSPEAVVDELIKNNKFGVLRADQSLNVVPTLAKDMLVAYRYAQKMQTELCPQGTASADNRPGQLFSKGVCLVPDSAVESQLNAIELMLSGQAAVLDAHVGNTTIPVLVNPTQFLNHPVANIRSLLPIKSDACKNLTAMGDGRLGGAFPTGDLNKLLQATSIEECGK